MLLQPAVPTVTVDRAIPRARPLLFSGNRLFCSYGNRIVSTSDSGRTFQDVCELKVPAKHRFSRVSAFARRLLRTDTYKMCELAGGNRAYIFRGGVFVQQFNRTTAECTIRVEKGSRPVSLACNQNGDVIFGEYWANHERDEVRIFGSVDGGLNWQVMHTFAPGLVRHVHEIQYDRFEDCYWICTGDYDDENRLIKASCDFSKVETVRKGGQGNRFFTMQILEKTIVAATDTPLEDNFVLVIDKQTGQARKAIGIDNASFYTCVVDGRVFVSTNAERSPVNDNRFSHIWVGQPSLNRWDKVLSKPVDVIDRVGRFPGLRNGFFQHPHFLFPDGTNPGTDLVFYGLGLRGLHDTLMFFDTRQLAKENPIDFTKAA